MEQEITLNDGEVVTVVDNKVLTAQDPIEEDRNSLEQQISVLEFDINRGEEAKVKKAKLEEKLALI